MPNNEEDASWPSNRHLLLAIFEAINALAVRLTNQHMVVACGDPVNGVRLGYSPSTVAWMTPTADAAENGSDLVQLDHPPSEGHRSISREES
jgi:hypothetical protein